LKYKENYAILILEKGVEMEQEKNKNGVIALLVVVIVILLALVILFATGTISLKSNETTNNQSSENTNNNVPETTNNTREDLSSDELNELSTFFDVYKSNENALMEFVTFSNPSELLDKNAANISNNIYYLQMILSGSKYSQQLDSEYVRTSSISLAGIKSQLKDLTNYDFSDESIKNYFSNFYKEDKDAYVVPTPGGAAMAGTIISSYKIGDKYYVNFSNNIDVVLQKVSNQYYFYSILRRWVRLFCLFIGIDE